MREQFSRMELILGEEAMDIIAHAHVAVFGVGGVGGYVVEALARCGIGALDLIDNDTVNITNLNRQIIATNASIGRNKVDVFRERVHDISPDTKVNTYCCFYLPEEKKNFDFSQYDYIVDAIDTVTAKLDLIEEAQRLGVPIISAMGCGNRMDPTKIRICDIYDTQGDPLSKIMRRELKKRHIKKLKVVYSTELPYKPSEERMMKEKEKEGTSRRSIPGSTAFVPAAGGLAMAYYVVQDLIKRGNR